MAQAYIMDTNSDYYLTKAVDCDFSSVNITLIRDRRMIPDWISSPTKEPLNLSTNTGEYIGMALSTLMKKLGKPTKQVRRGAQSQYTCLLYRAVRMEDKTFGQRWDRTYIFKGGKLIEINLNYQSIPGCGDSDPYSLTHWPPGKF